MRAFLSWFFVRIAYGIPFIMLWMLLQRLYPIPKELNTALFMACIFVPGILSRIRQEPNAWNVWIPPKTIGEKFYGMIAFTGKVLGIAVLVLGVCTFPLVLTGHTLAALLGHVLLFSYLLLICLLIRLLGQSGKKRCKARNR